MEKVNIIIATYQGGKYIRQQLDSILASEDAEFMISIYDDGSKDDTAAIVEEYVKKYPDQVQFVRNAKNLGHLQNFLQGVVNNPYDYVMFCDQDDVWKPEKIMKTYRCMKEAESQQNEPMPLVVFTDAVIVDENLKELNPSFHQSSGLDTGKLDLAHLLMENKMMGCTMMLNRPLLDRITVLPEHARFHDWWIALIAAAYGKILYLPEGTMLYRQHGNNVVGNRSFRQYVLQRLANLKEQKKAINKLIDQAEEFYQIYQNTLSPQAKRLVEKFLSLRTSGYIKRRYLVLHYGFLKSGLVRNLGLLLIL